MMLAGLLLVCGAARAGESRRTVLLLEKPDRFVILNKYQQRLTTSEYRALPAFLPMTVIREHDKLSDAITPCVTAAIEETPYFVQEDIGGELLRRGSGGNATFYRDAVWFGDTVAVLKGVALRMRDAEQNREVVLSQGTLVARYFEAGGRSFARVLPAGHPSGWLALPTASEHTDWMVERTRRTQGISASGVEIRLLPVIAAANRALRSMLAQISSETRLSRGQPSFRLWSNANALHCTVEPDTLRHAFSASLRELLPACDNALAGTGLHPTLMGGAIVIPLR
jgi:hypothetical protein